MTKPKGLALALGLLTSVVMAPAAYAQTLTVWGSEQQSDPLVAELWEEIATSFEAKHDGVSVEYMAPTGNISNGAVQAAIQSNAGPDVLLTNSGIGRVTIVAEAGLVLPLSDQYAEYGWDTKLYPWLYEELKTQFDGELYEVPDGIDAIGLWYHKDLFEQNGWSLDGGWADFTATLDSIRGAGMEPIAVGVRGCCNGGHLFGNFLQAAAGSEVMGHVMKGEVQWADPAPLSGAQNLIEAVKAGYISPQMTGLDQDAAIRLWVNKRAALFVGGPWFIGNVRQNGYDVANLGYAPIPSDLPEGSRPTGGVGWSWMVPTSSDQPELAFAWIDHMLSDEIMTLRAEHPTGNQMMSRDLPDIQPAVAVMSEVYAAAAEGVGYNPSVYIPGAALDTYYQVIGGLIGGQVSAGDGMAQIDARMGD
ncbi:ABC transporter substrate-binding protein [Devosia geojensis]|uniref:ABC transporter substrate-binding protein n=1 Tax=Devosia geojensis TaxID=443610 RepID=A0A0F5FRR9_9HYPH|nr:extracellular solute-binding protein [Devosia geojensis]KKB11280.1 ABC transporter substrate-binding protein [Devosia geojensis]